ncbi:MAG: hypothetical protein U0230_15085 [Polyangiales bacterium]
MSRAPAIVCLLALLSGCHYYEHRVDHAQQAYEEGRYADADAWLDLLDTHVGEMDAHLEGRYYYLRGMSEYHVGHRDEALHHLALARQVTRGQDHLTQAEQETLERTYAELVPTEMTHHAAPASAAPPAAASPAASEPPAEPATP